MHRENGGIGVCKFQLLVKLCGSGLSSADAAASSASIFLNLDSSSATFFFSSATALSEAAFAESLAFLSFSSSSATFFFSDTAAFSAVAFSLSCAVLSCSSNCFCCSTALAVSSAVAAITFSSSALAFSCAACSALACRALSSYSLTLPDFSLRAAISLAVVWDFQPPPCFSDLTRHKI